MVGSGENVAVSGAQGDTAATCDAPVEDDVTQPRNVPTLLSASVENCWLCEDAKAYEETRFPFWRGRGGSGAEFLRFLSAAELLFARTLGQHRFHRHISGGLSRRYRTGCGAEEANGIYGFAARALLSGLAAERRG